MRIEKHKMNNETNLYFPIFHTDHVNFIPVSHPKTTLLC